MNTIKLNDLELEVTGYSKNIYFNDNIMSSNASCQVVTNNSEAIVNLAKETITSIQIKHDNEVIYDLPDINAKVTSINEYLNINKVDVNMALAFEDEEL